MLDNGTTGPALYFRRPLPGELPWLDPKIAANIASDPDINSIAAFQRAKCVMVVGIRRMHKNAGEVFFCLGPGARGRTFIEMRKRYHLMIGGYHRVQAAINISNEKSARFARWVGLSPECIMREAGPEKETWMIMATIKGVNR